MSNHENAPADSIAEIHAPNALLQVHPARQDAEAAAAYSPVNPTQLMMNKASFTMEGMRDVATL